MRIIPGYIKIFLVAASMLLLACRKDGDGGCGSLALAIEEMDHAELQKQVTFRARRLGVVTDANFEPVEAKLKVLAQMFDLDCNVAAEVICTMCISTAPPLSQLRISYNSGSVQKTVIIELYTEYGKLIRFAEAREEG